MGRVSRIGANRVRRQRREWRRPLRPSIGWRVADRVRCWRCGAGEHSRWKVCQRRRGRSTGGRCYGRRGRRWRLRRRRNDRWTRRRLSRHGGSRLRRRSRAGGDARAWTWRNRARRNWACGVWLGRVRHGRVGRVRRHPGGRGAGGSGPVIDGGQAALDRLQFLIERLDFLLESALHPSGADERRERHQRGDDEDEEEGECDQLDH